MQELKEIDDVMRKINIEGCIPAIQAFIERNLYTVGGIAIAIALSQVLLTVLTYLRMPGESDGRHLLLLYRYTRSLRSSVH